MKLKNINILLLLFICAGILNAQDDITILPDLTDTAELSFKIPEAIPCKNFYGDYWRTDHIRVGKINPPTNETLLKIFNDECIEFVCPFPGKVISPYGMRKGRPHTGTDIKLQHGDTVRAAFSGIVRMSKVYSAYGYLVLIRHSNGLETVYAHLSKPLVKPNQAVRAGEPIGLGGRTGRATTDHLHFETRFLLEPFNPELLIDFNTQQLRTSCLVYQNGKIKDAFIEDMITEANTDEEGEIILDIDNENESSTVTKKTQETPKNTAQTAKPQQNKYHTVKQGDTLYSISRKYNTTVENLRKWNKIGQDNRIAVGRKLIVS